MTIFAKVYKFQVIKSYQRISIRTGLALVYAILSIKGCLAARNSKIRIRSIPSQPWK